MMLLACTGAYFHFTKDSSDAPVPSEMIAKQESTPVLNEVEPQQTEVQAVERKPASQTNELRAPAYAPQGATGYLNFKTFPAATEIYVDDQVLVDAAGTPVRTPANLLKVEVGNRKLKLFNKALGLSWEGEVDVEFDSVKTLEVRLK